MSSYNITLSLPVYYTQEFKTKPSKTFLVGLNWERNAHYFIKSQVKREYHDLVHNQIEAPNSSINKFLVHTTIYWKNSNSDPRNVAPLIEKYVLDALQIHNVLTNDNAKFDMGGTFTNGGQDKDNPRCEIRIEEYNNAN